MICNKRVLWINNFDFTKNNTGCFVKFFYFFLKSKYFNDNLTIINFKSYSLTKKIFFGFTLRAISKNFDIIHFQYGSFYTFYYSLFVPRKKIVVSFRGSDINYLPFSIKYFSPFFYSFLSCFVSRLSLLRIKNVIVMSYRMKKSFYNKFYLNHKITVIPDPLNIIIDKPKSPFIKNNKKLEIGFVTSDKKSYVKNKELALLSIKKLSLIRDDFTFNIYSGLSFEKMQKQLRDKIDVLLITSFSEGYPNIVKEAIYYGKPVVSTDISDLKLLFKNASLSKALKSDPCLISEHLSYVIENYSLYSDNLPIKQFLPDRISKKLISFYNLD